MIKKRIKIVISVLIGFLLILSMLYIPINSDLNEIKTTDSEKIIKVSGISGSTNTRRPQVSDPPVLSSGGCWLDTFEDETKIESKIDLEVINDNAQLASTMNLITTTADFDAGVKYKTETNTDSIEVPAGELHLSKYYSFIEDFEGVDGQNIDVYDPSWTVTITDSSTINIKTDQKISGSASAKWFADDTTWGISAINRTIPNMADKVLSMYIRVNVVTLGSEPFGITTFDNTGNRYALFCFGTSGGSVWDLCYYNGGTLINTGYSYSQDIWYNLKIIQKTATGTWDAWVDGGSFNNFQAVNNANRRDAGNNIITELNISRSNAHSGQHPEQWVDRISIFNYSLNGSWQSAQQSLLPEQELRDTTLMFSGLAPGSAEIDKVEWKVGGITQAIYDTNIVSDALSPLTIKETDLTSGSFTNINSDYKIELELLGGGLNTPAIEQISSRMNITSGNLTSVPITIPVNNVWDTLTINKTQPPNSLINVTILDGQTNLPIPGFSELTVTALNISSIDPILYQTIKLTANFSTNDIYSSPILHNWSVSWMPDPPKLHTIIPSDFSFPEDTDADNLINLSHYFSDVWTAFNKLIFQIVNESNSTNIDATVDGWHLDFTTPTVNWSGYETFIVNCTDEGNLINVTNEFTVTVVEVNDPPVWTPMDIFHILEDSPRVSLIECDGNITDCDDMLGNITYTILSNNNSVNVSVEVENRCIYVEPIKEHYYGIADVVLRADDGIDFTDLDIQIIIDSINDPPVWKDIYRIYLDEDINATNIIDLKGNASDVDNTVDGLTFGIIQNTNVFNIEVKINQNDFIDINILKPNYIGAANITVRANDTINYTDEQFEVIINPVNDAPFWADIPDLHVDEDTNRLDAVDLTNYAIDVDTDISELEFSINENTKFENINVVIDSNNNVDIFTLTEDYVGTATVTVKVSDTQKSAITSFEVIIDPINDPPIWKNIPDYYLNEDIDALNALFLGDYISDIDTELDELEFTIESNSNKFNIKVSIDTENNLDITTPADNYVGSATIILKADDGFEYDEITFDIIVEPVNDRPLWKPLPDIHLDEDTDALQAKDLRKYIDDVDNDVKEITFTIISNPNSNNISVTISSIKYIDIRALGDNYFGDTIIIIRATDGLNYSDTQLKIIVDPVNDPPTVKITLPIEGSKYKTGDMIEFNCTHKDVDLGWEGSDESVTITWISNQEPFQFGTGTELKDIQLPAGEHNIIVKAIDNEGAEGVDYVNITVEVPGGAVNNVIIFSFIVILIVVIIICLVILFLYFRARKKKMGSETVEAQPSPPLPTDSHLPATPSLPALPQPQTPLLPSLPAVPVTVTTPTVGVVEQLPSVGSVPSLAPRLPPAEEPEGEPKLSKDEKLRLLEERLSNGVINQDLYDKLKKQFEMEEPGEEVQPTSDVPSTVQQPELEAPAPIPPTPQLTPTITTPSIIKKPEGDQTSIEGGKETPTSQDEDIFKPFLIQSKTKNKHLDEQNNQTSDQPSNDNMSGDLCPQCNSTDIQSYPDNSHSCASCGFKWI